MDPYSGTLVDKEQSWTPMTYAICGVCLAMGVLMLGVAGWHATVDPAPVRITLLLVLCAAWLVPVASNALFYARHRKPTVGMVPIAAFSLAPASLAAIACPGLPLGLLVACALCLTCAILTGAVFGWWFWRLHAVYAHAAHVEPDAALIVLGGAVRNGQPCRTLVRRLEAARSVWETRPESLLLVTGGTAPDGIGTEAEAMTSYLMGRGVPATSIVPEPLACNTGQNIVNSLALLRRRGFEGQLCVVTSDYHLYRAVTLGRENGVELVPIPAATPWTSRPQQWCREVLTIFAQR